MAQITKLGLGGIPDRSVAVAQAYALTADQGSYTQTGEDAALRVARYVPESVGTYTKIGQAAALVPARKIVATQATYTWDGKLTTLAATRIVTGDQGTYTKTGEAANVTHQSRIVQTVGSYTLFGQSIPGLAAPEASTITKLGLAGVPTEVPAISRSLANGAYAINGQSATLVYARKPAEAFGQYVLTGKTLQPIAARKMAATGTSFVLSGQIAIPAVGRKLTSVRGSYVLTGRTAAFAVQHVAGQSFGSYTVTGEIALGVKTLLFVATNGNYALAGRDANSLHTYVLQPITGSLSLGGQSSGEIAARDLHPDSGTYAKTGNVSGLAVGRATEAGEGGFFVAGQEASLVQSGQGNVQVSWAALLLPGVVNVVTMPAAQGSYFLTGKDATVLQQPHVAAGTGFYSFVYSVTVEAGNYTYNGEPAALAWNAPLPAEVGSYSLTGYDVARAPLFADMGAYSIVGQVFPTLFLVDQGNYALHGRAAGLQRSFPLSAGVYTLAGQTLGKVQDYDLAADQGFYTLLGEQVLSGVSAQTGGYALAGQNVAVPPRFLTVTRGLYVLRGKDAELIYSAARVHVIAKNRTDCIGSDDRGMCIEHEDRRRVA